MPPPSRPWPRFAGPVRSLLDRSALGALVVLSALLLVLGKADVRLAGYVDDRLTDAVTPVLAALDRPVVAVRATFDAAGGLLAAYEENARLREENRRLLGWQAEAARLAVDNRALRRMLAVPTAEHPAAWLTARVVGDSGGSFVQAVLLDAGAEQGVAAGMPATTPDGLVGRVIDVGARSARALLITDFNSRIPVVVESSGDHALLEGDNSPLPVLRFLPLKPGFAIGDRVLTSGRGGLLPPGLAIGRIEAGDRGSVRVRPFVDWARLDYVALLAVAPTPLPDAAGS
jgi:rod shape-determining protein MreC